MSDPLLTAEMKLRLPELYSQEDVSDPTVHVLLCGANGWIWALTEYSETAPDGCPHLAFGWVAGDFNELGYILLPAGGEEEPHRGAIGYHVAVAIQDDPSLQRNGIPHIECWYRCRLWSLFRSFRRAFRQIQ